MTLPWFPPQFDRASHYYFSLSGYHYFAVEPAYWCLAKQAIVSRPSRESDRHLLELVCVNE